MQEVLTIRLYSSWMYMHIHPYSFVFLRPFVDELTKKGRRIRWVYICMFILFPRLCKKGKKNLVSLCMFISLFMHIYIVWFVFLPLCWWIDKKGKKYLENLYMHVYFISLFMQKGEKEFGEFIYVYLCIYVLFGLCTLLNIFMFIVMHELWGSFYEAYL